MKRLDTQPNNPTNLSIKTLVVKPTNKKLENLGTSLIKSPMSPPSMRCICITVTRIKRLTVNYYVDNRKTKYQFAHLIVLSSNLESKSFFVLPIKCLWSTGTPHSLFLNIFKMRWVVSPIPYEEPLPCRAYQYTI